jgi:hypothetical protein
MTRPLGKLLFLVLALGVAPLASSQGAVEAYLVVERFADALNAGIVADARASLGQNVTWVEYDLTWRVATGRLQAGQRAAQLIEAGVRLEIEVVAIVGGGTMAVAHERMWGVFDPEDLAPMRSTTVYLVEAGRLVGITRVLTADQRDALLTAASVGIWSRAGHYARHDADGRYHTFRDRADLLAERPYDGGTYTIVGGVATYVSDETSEVCDPGDRSAFRLQMSDGETLHLDPVQSEIECAHRRYAYVVTYARVAEE